MPRWSSYLASTAKPANRPGGRPSVVSMGLKAVSGRPVVLDGEIVSLEKTACRRSVCPATRRLLIRLPFAVLRGQSEHA